jgi:hypothetical protein
LSLRHGRTLKPKHALGARRREHRGRFRPHGEIHEWRRDAKFAAVAWALAIDLLGMAQTAIEELTNRYIRPEQAKGRRRKPYAYAGARFICEEACRRILPRSRGRYQHAGSIAPR